VFTEGKLCEVVFSDDEIEQLKAGKAVTSDAPQRPVRRWTTEETLPHLARRR
jgi:hypothetical protein